MMKSTTIPILFAKVDMLSFKRIHSICKIMAKTTINQKICGTKNAISNCGMLSSLIHLDQTVSLKIFFKLRLLSKKDNEGNKTTFWQALEVVPADRPVIRTDLSIFSAPISEGDMRPVSFTHEDLDQDPAIRLSASMGWRC